MRRGTCCIGDWLRSFYLGSIPLSFGAEVAIA